MSKLGAKVSKAKRVALAEAAPSAASPALTRYSPQPTIQRNSGATSYSELVWGTIESALTAAMRGDTAPWVAVCRRMTTDPHLMSVVTTYVSAIAGARREVTPKKVDPALQGFADLAAADCEEMLSALPNIERTIAEMVDADGVGFAVHEIMWEAKADRVVPKDLLWLSQERFRFSNFFECYLWDQGLAAKRAEELGIDGKPQGIPGLPLTPRKYIVHIPRILPAYPMTGLFAGCVRYWYLKSWALKYWLAGSEAAGNPRTLGKLAEDAPESVRDQLYEALAGLSADGVGVVSGGTEIETLDVKAQGAGSIWETLIKLADSGFSKAWLGSTLNVEVGDTGGNRSLGESQADMTMAPRWARSSALVANTLERDLFAPFLYFNRHRYGGRSDLVPSLTLHIVEETPNVDDVAIAAGVVTVDELRRSRKLEPFGSDNGGDVRIPAAAPAASAFSAEAAPAVPFQAKRLAASRPWTTARHLLTRSATETSGR